MITWSQPWARATAAFSSDDTVPITVSPSSFAHCDTMRPTPPAAACSRIVSPAWSGQMRRIRYADVRPRIVIAAAVSQEMPSGSLISGAAGMRRSVLYAPSVLTKPV